MVLFIFIDGKAIVVVFNSSENNNISQYFESEFEIILPKFVLMNASSCKKISSTSLLCSGFVDGGILLHFVIHNILDFNRDKIVSLY